MIGTYASAALICAVSLLSGVGPCSPLGGDLVVAGAGGRAFGAV